MRKVLILFRLENKIFKKKLFTGSFIFVTPSDHIQKDIFWYGFYEKDSVLTWHSFIKNDSVVFDIGANIGFYTLVAANKIKTGHIYAFEPVKDIVRLLKTNIELNNFNNISIIPFAVSNKKTISPIYISSQDNLGMSGFHKPQNYSGKIDYVETISLDEWIKEMKIPKLDVVKIDVEGAELQVLKGMKKIIESNKPIFFIELINENLKKFGHDISDIYNFFKHLDYEPFEIIQPKQLRILNVEKESYCILFLPKNYKFQNDIILY